MYIFTNTFCIFDHIRFIRLTFVVNFCFFHGDPRYLIYVTPFSFLVWILRFVDYYNVWLIKANLSMLNDLVHTSFRNPDMMQNHRTDDKGFCKCQRS